MTCTDQSQVRETPCMRESGIGPGPMGYTPGDPCTSQCRHSFREDRAYAWDGTQSPVSPSVLIPAGPVRSWPWDDELLQGDFHANRFANPFEELLRRGCRPPALAGCHESNHRSKLLLLCALWVSIDPATDDDAAIADLTRVC